MVRAAATGRLDYSRADSNDWRWTLRERILLMEIERDYFVQVTERRQLQQAVTAVWPSGDTKGEMFKVHYDRANEHLQFMSRLLLPYLKWDENSQRKSEMAQMRAEYVAKFGDPSSPEVKKRIEKDAEEFKKNQLLSAQRRQAEAEAMAKREVEILRLRSKRAERRGR